jgi:hypothetical protein
MDKASDSLQVYPVALLNNFPVCRSLLPHPQILITSADAHARSIAAADLAAGANIFIDSFSVHVLLIASSVSCDYQFAEWLLNSKGDGALNDVFSLLSTCEGEVLHHVCHAGADVCRWIGCIHS